MTELFRDRKHCMKSFFRMRLVLFSGFIALYVVLSLKVMMMFIPASSYGMDMHMNNKINGEQSPPASYRMLVPWISREMVGLMPEAVRENLTPTLITLRDSAFVSKWWASREPRVVDAAVNDSHIFNTCVDMAVIYVTLLAFVWSLYHLASLLLPHSITYRLMAPLVALLLIAPLNKVFAYSYDYAELFFSCALLSLLLRERWWAYVVCLGFATLNKETAIFAVVFYFIWAYKKLPMKRYLTMGIVQMAVYGMVEMLIWYHFSDMDGMGPASPSYPPYAPSFFDVMYVSIDLLTSGFAGLLHEHPNMYAKRALFLLDHDYTTFVHFMITALFLTYRWVEKPELLRSGLWIAAMNVIAFVFFCNTAEFRDLFFCMPVLVLLATHTLISASGLENALTTPTCPSCCK